MNIIFEVSTTNYDKDIEFVSNALEDLQKLCDIDYGYKFGKPVSRFGWTFFKLWITPNLHLKIYAEFSDMIKKAKGRKQNEKFTNFMSDFFTSRECNVKLKIAKED